MSRTFGLQETESNYFSWQSAIQIHETQHNLTSVDEKLKPINIQNYWCGEFKCSALSKQSSLCGRDKRSDRARWTLYSVNKLFKRFSIHTSQ